MRLRDRAAVRAVGARAAVVRALRAGEAALRPAERVTLSRLKRCTPARGRTTGPGGAGLEDRLRRCARVRRERRAARRVRVGQHEDVVATTERVLVDGTGLDDDLGVLARGLVGGGAIVVPRRELVKVRLGGRHGLALGADVALGIDPDVLGLDLAGHGELHVALEDAGRHLDLLGHHDGRRAHRVRAERRGDEGRRRERDAAVSMTGLFGVASTTRGRPRRYHVPRYIEGDFHRDFAH